MAGRRFNRRRPALQSMNPELTNLYDAILAAQNWREYYRHEWEMAKKELARLETENQQLRDELAMLKSK